MYSWMSLPGLGDVPFKQPPEFTRRILYNLLPGFQDTTLWEEFLVRNRTPPYISAEPEITHRRLEPLPPYLATAGVNGPTTPQRYLVIFSDGFADLCSNCGLQRVLSSWAQEMNDLQVATVDADLGMRRKADNMALRLLRQALGGDDSFSVSRALTLDMDVAWMDDTAIVVQTM
jgi:pyruvate dehydrogenase phosphatase